MLILLPKAAIVVIFTLALLLKFATLFVGYIAVIVKFGLLFTIWELVEGRAERSEER